MAKEIQLAINPKINEYLSSIKIVNLRSNKKRALRKF